MGGFWVFPGGAVEPGRPGGDGRRRRAPRGGRARAGRGGVRRGRRPGEPRRRTAAGSRRWAARIRFDTRFFLGAAPDGAEPRVDGEECVDVGWFAPAAALDAYDRDELPLVFPTLKHFEAIAAVRDRRASCSRRRAGASSSRSTRGSSTAGSCCPASPATWSEPPSHGDVEALGRLVGDLGVVDDHDAVRRERRERVLDRDAAPRCPRSSRARSTPASRSFASVSSRRSCASSIASSESETQKASGEEFTAGDTTRTCAPSTSSPSSRRSSDASTGDAASTSTFTLAQYPRRARPHNRPSTGSRPSPAAGALRPRRDLAVRRRPRVAVLLFASVPAAGLVLAARGAAPPSRSSRGGGRGARAGRGRRLLLVGRVRHRARAA